MTQQGTGNAVDRRNFLKLTLAATSLALTVDQAAAARSSDKSPLIDVNVNLGRWPLRRVTDDDTRELATTLRRHGVVQAWTGTFEGLLHKDIGAANARLAHECRRDGRGILLPFGSLNPKLPDWEEELRRCAEEHHMPGIRLHPNYHGYKLDDPDFAKVLTAATARGLIVQLALVMEDERMMHRLMRVEPVSTQPLAALVKRTPGLRLVLLNALRTLSGKALVEVVSAGKVFVEISMLEGVAGIEKLLKQIPAQQILFGSYAPLFYFESALLKLQESPLSNEDLRAISHQNVRTQLAVAVK